jgi:flagellar basal body-associated protein FliL
MTNILISDSYLTQVMVQIEKNWAWFIPITALIICSAVLVFVFFDASDITCQGEGQGRNMMLIYSILIVIIIILALAFPVTYVYISHNLKKEIEKNIQIISQITTDNEKESLQECPPISKSCKTFVLKFLDYNENRVIKKLIENNGSVLQSEIGRLPNMGKVKAHRVLKDMEIKGIIRLEKYGKTNKVYFSDDAHEVFLS